MSALVNNWLRVGFIKYARSKYGNIDYIKYCIDVLFEDSYLIGVDESADYTKIYLWLWHEENWTKRQRKSR